MSSDYNDYLQLLKKLQEQRDKAGDAKPTFNDLLKEHEDEISTQQAGL